LRLATRKSRLRGNYQTATLSPQRLLCRSRCANCSISKPDRRRIRSNPESGQAIPNPPDPHAESCRYLAFGKTVDGSILRPQRQDSPRTVSNGEARLQKMSEYFDPCDAKRVFGTFYFPSVILRVWVVWVSFRRFWQTGLLGLRSCMLPSQSSDQPCAAILIPSSTASSPSPR
jgi:hypothetical protein